MWDAVRSRQHRIEKIYHFGPNATELRIFGTVAYELKDRRKAETPWGSRVTMVKESDVWKMKFYQVYLVRAIAVWLEFYYSIDVRGELTNHNVKILR
jgi:hypothetical protein